MNNNVLIRNLYAPGFSFVTFSFYKTNLSISFTPWLGQNDVGISQYDTKNFLSTTINDESAASLYLLAKLILDGNQRTPLLYTIECNGQTKLTFEYRPDQNNQMRAYLSIEKNNTTIPFEFAVHQYKVKENGRVVVKEIQAGLQTFAQVMVAYLIAVGADRRLNNQQDEYSNVQFDTSTWNG